MRFDPIYQFGKRLIDQERFTQPELDALDKEIVAQIEESVRFAEKSPWPKEEDLYEHVYVRSPYIHMKSAERDPAWRAARREDTLPQEFPAPVKVGS
jgi:TPP-dependent pyruvate/acetoin dehydrogenase alpha subunit